MNGKDFIQVMEYMKTFSKPDKTRRPKKDPKPADLLELMHNRLREAKEIADFLKDQEKINKKEEKKDDKKGLSAPQIAMFLVLTFPITAPLYVAYIKALLH